MPDRFRLVSFFDTLTEAAFTPFAMKGIDSPASLQLSAARRDADPLICQGDQFTSEGLENWVDLL